MSYASWEDYAKAELEKAQGNVTADGCDYDAATYHATVANYYMLMALIDTLRRKR